MAGTLFVVATPIGNLEDLTFRALRTLKEVDLIAAEDTRRTANLLAHYEVRKSVVSLREHNEVRETPRLLARLAAGESIALVTDAGTPGISDPGAKLVRAAHDAGLPVVPVPGPSAVTAALSVSGFAADQFLFLGFPPRAGRARKDWFLRLAGEPGVVVFFEAPHRVTKTIGELAEITPNRRITSIREISKKHEQLVVSTNPYAAVEKLKEIGEFVFVVGQAPERIEPGVDAIKASSIIGCLTDHGSFDYEDALVLTSSALHVDPSALKKAVKKHLILAKRQIE